MYHFGDQVGFSSLAHFEETNYNMQRIQSLTVGLKLYEASSEGN